MKFLTKNKGFTVVELVFVMSLLGALTIGSGAYLSDAFKDSNNLSNKAEVQASVGALMNKLETTIKEANIPVFNNSRTVGETFTNEDFEIDSTTFDYNSANKNIKVNGTTYEYIEKITVKVFDNGAEITIVGEGNKYSLTSTYYSRNQHIHSYTWLETRPATCTTEGEKKGTCSCGSVIIREIPIVSHEFDSWINYDADKHVRECRNCSEEEFEEHYDSDGDQKCDACLRDLSTESGETGRDHSHSYNWVITKQATCTEEGVKTGTCRCGDVKESTISKLAHTANNWESDANEHWKVCIVCINKFANDVHTFVNNKCIVCGYEVMTEDEHTHSYTWIVTKQATCTNEGEETGTCRCGDIQTRIIPKLPHTSNDWQKDEAYHWKICTVCTNKFDNGIHIFVDNICKVCGYGHTHIWNNGEIIKQATCTEKGQIKYTCTVSMCGETRLEEIPMIGHTVSWEISQTQHYQTCEKCGYTISSGAHEFVTEKTETTHYDKCSVCGYMKNEGAHTFEVEKSATQHYEICSVCDYMKNAEEHTFKVEKSATQHYEVCSVCDYTKNPQAHTFEVEKSATQHYEACSVCGYTKKGEAHTFEVEKSATQHYEACSVCDYTKNAQAHAFEVIKSETQHYEECKDCGYTKNVENHNFNWEKSSLTHYKVCEGCGYTSELGTHTYSGNKCTTCGYIK